jgi:hypothetical protein
MQAQRNNVPQTLTAIPYRRVPLQVRTKRGNILSRHSMVHLDAQRTIDGIGDPGFRPFRPFRPGLRTKVSVLQRRSILVSYVPLAHCPGSPYALTYHET